MVKVKIYPACLKCDYPKFDVSELMHEVSNIDTESEILTDDHISCKHSKVCKFINGQEPIDLDKSIYSTEIEYEPITKDEDRGCGMIGTGVYGYKAQISCPNCGVTLRISE